MTCALGLGLATCAPTEGTGGSAGGGQSGSGGSANAGSGGATASGGASAGASGGSAGTGGATGGTAAPGGATGTGGAAGSGGATGSGGRGGTTGGSGGSTPSGGRGGGTAGGSGASGTAGVSGRGGASGGSGGASGRGGASGGGGTGGVTPTGPDQCRPVGWATRASRTGGAFDVTGGGTAAPIVVTTFAALQMYASDAQARVIHVDGTLGAGWSGSSGDRLEIKSNKTIVGLRAGTQLRAAIHINAASNVILRNIVVRGPGSNDAQAWDNINIEGSKNVWVDHCEFWDGQDGNADVIRGADAVTFSWCIFGYALSGHTHNLSNLIASSDSEPESEGKLDITYMFNWWNAATERQPRCRYGYIHVVNNLYTASASVGASKLGVTNGFSCNVLTENNHFISQNVPIDLGKQAGTGSVQQAVGNMFESCTGNQQGSGTAFTPPYEYKSFMVPAAQVKALVQARAGATLTSPTACQ